MQQEGVEPALGQQLDLFVAEQGRYLRDDAFRHLPGEVIGTPREQRRRRLRRADTPARRILFPSENYEVLSGIGG